LAPGDIIRGEIKPGDKPSFQASLIQGKFYRVLLGETGTDLDLHIVGPIKSSRVPKEIEGGSPFQFKGLDSISIVAEETGDYLIEISSSPSLPGGSYEISLEGPREPTTVDLERLAAEAAFREAIDHWQKKILPELELCLGKLQEALGHWKSVDDPRWIAYSQCWIGRVHKRLDHFAAALAAFDEGISELTASDDIGGQAFILNEKGACIRELDNSADAIPVYENALALRQRAGDQRGSAQVLNNIGLVYKNLGQDHQAAEAFGKAIAIWHTINDRFNEFYTRNNLSGPQDALGDSALALENVNGALAYCKEASCKTLGNRDLDILAENNAGMIYENRGETAEALEHYERSFELARDREIPYRIALALNNLGWLHVGLGDVDRALELLEQSLAIRRGLNSPSDLAATLVNIAYAYSLKGMYPEALRNTDEAMPLSSKANDQRFISHIQTVRGVIFEASGRLPDALTAYEIALRLQESIGNRRAQAVSLEKIGTVYRKMGNRAESATKYDLALKQWIASGDKQGEALTLYNYADLEWERGNLDAAREKVEAAIDIVESLRTNLSSDRLRRTYFASKQDFYALDIDVRMQLYKRDHKEADRDAALAASEKSRARNLLDLLQDTNHDGGAGIDPELAEQYRRVNADLTAANESWFKLKSLNRAEDAAGAEKHFNDLMREGDRLRGQIRRSQPGYAELTEPATVKVPQIQKLLDEGTLLLEYSLGEPRSYVWAVTRSGVAGYELPGRSVIEKQAVAVRADLTAPEGRLPGESGQDYDRRVIRAKTSLPKNSDALSQTVLEKVRKEITQAKRLVIVADGGLQSIPFEMLSLPTAKLSPRGATTASKPELLATTKVIAYQPSVSALSLIRNSKRPAAAKTVAVLADPVFEAADERMDPTAKVKPPQPPPPVKNSSSADLTRSLRDFGDGTSDRTLARLSYSGTEADEIVALVPSAQSLKITGFDAKLERAMAADLAEYRIVHIASHTLITPRNPEMSGIVLSLLDQEGNPRAGFLNLNNIYNLRLPVDLVVLSACRTGIGDEVRGEGLMGLTRGFMYAGARRVVVSLWKVDDKATAAFMGYFYQHMLKDHRSAAVALHDARIDMMGQPEWESPFYWAGFVLQGEWQ
jgi:CHAT domain-containing protein/tetratricopeptide (TPR) repeat protein